MKHSVEVEPVRDELAELRRDPRRAVREEEIVCLVCGRAFRQLTNTRPDLRRRGGARQVRLEELLTRQEIQRNPRARWDRRDGAGRFATESAPHDA